VALEAHIAPKVAVNRTSATVMQWAAMALVGAAGPVLLGHGLRRGHAEAPPPEVTVQAPEPTPAREAVGSLPEPPGVPSAKAAPPKASERSSPTLRPPAPPAVAPSAPQGTLADELALLDAARRALRRGNARVALSELDRHQAEFPRGLLGQEATLLRIEALVRSGNRPAAEALARQFLARQPNSPHAKRIESLLGQAERR